MLKVTDTIIHAKDGVECRKYNKRLYAERLRLRWKILYKLSSWISASNNFEMIKQLVSLNFYQQKELYECLIIIDKASTSSVKLWKKLLRILVIQNQIVFYVATLNNILSFKFKVNIDQSM